MSLEPTVTARRLAGPVILAAAFVLTSALPSSAQLPAPGGPPRADRPAADSATPVLLPSFGFREYGPIRHSIYWGTHRVTQRGQPGPHHVPAHGPAMMVEAGEGGWQLGVGYGRIAAPFAAVRIHALYLETWGRPLGTTPEQKYVGGEVRLSFLGLGVGFLGYRHVYGARDMPAGPPWVGAVTAVVGL